MLRSQLRPADNLTMPVTIDHVDLKHAELGLSTMGEVLQRIRKQKRLVVRLVIDGQAPDLRDIPSLHATPLKSHAIFIETAAPADAAMEVLVGAYQELDNADRIKEEAADLLRGNQWKPAMERIGQCLKSWQAAQQAIVSVGKLFNLNLDHLNVAGRPIRVLSEEFARQLRDLQTAIKSTDLVAITDVLVYETAHTGDNWRAAIEAVREVIAKPMTIQSGV